MKKGCKVTGRGRILYLLKTPISPQVTYYYFYVTKNNEIQILPLVLWFIYLLEKRSKWQTNCAIVFTRSKLVHKTSKPLLPSHSGLKSYFLVYRQKLSETVKNPTFGDDFSLTPKVPWLCYHKKHSKIAISSISIKFLKNIIFGHM